MADKRLYHKLSFYNPALAVVSGVLLVLSFPRPGLYPLAWIALVPLLVALRRSKARSGFALGLLTGIVFFAGLIYWVALFGYVPYILLSVLKALEVGVFGLLAAIIYRRERLAAMAIPALWTTMEWLRSLGSLAFPWGGLVYSQSPWTSLIQLAGITGPWGITFLIVLLNEVIAGFIVRRDKTSIRLSAVTAALVIVTAPGGWLYASHKPVSEPRTRVAMVQGGVELTWPNEETLRSIVETYWPMTEQLRGSADLIIWPESALPGDMLADTALQREISRLAKTTGAWMLVGGYHAEPHRSVRAGYREYNGAYLVGPDGEPAGTYYKVHLVPFGEFVPGRSRLPFLDRYHVLNVDRSPGPGYNLLHARFGDIGTMICFESTFPQIGREFARRGADVLVVITNDSWFGTTAAAAQHHQFSVLRAVETRKYVLRNATTGISSLIAPTGQIMATAGLGDRAVVTGIVAMQSGRTFYVRFGDWFAYLCALISIGTLFSVRRGPLAADGNG